MRKLASVDTIRLGIKLKRYIAAHGIKVVHSYDSSGIFGLAIAQLARVPVVIGSQLSYRDILDPKHRSSCAWLIDIQTRYSPIVRPFDGIWSRTNT